MSIASRKRGAWIETIGYAGYIDAGARIASRKRGAWIETEGAEGVRPHERASPPGNGGRGLKQLQPAQGGLTWTGIASRKRGAWIETSHS